VPQEHAFAGLVAVVAATPQALIAPSRAPAPAGVSSGSTTNNNSRPAGGTGAVAVAHAFFLALASWEDPPEDPQLLQQLGHMLGAVKAGNPGAWRAVLAVVDRDTAHRTLDMFRLVP